MASRLLCLRSHQLLATLWPPVASAYPEHKLVHSPGFNCSEDSAIHLLKATWGGPASIRIIHDSAPFHIRAGAVVGGLCFRREACCGTVAERPAGMAGPTDAFEQRLKNS